jgi:hypothetical protein
MEGLMEPVTTLALTTISFLVPYFKKFAEGVATELGKKTAGAPAEIYHFLKDKFAPGSSGNSALESFKDKPEDNKAQEQLKAAISSLAATDARFAADLQALLSKAQGAGSAAFTTNVHGDSNKVANINQVTGDVNF